MQQRVVSGVLASSPWGAFGCAQKGAFPRGFCTQVSVLLFGGWKGSAAFLKQQLAEVQHYAT